MENYYRSPNDVVKDSNDGTSRVTQEDTQGVMLLLHLLLKNLRRKKVLYILQALLLL